MSRISSTLNTAGSMGMSNQPLRAWVMLTRSNRKVLGVLEDVANQLQFLKTVADAEIVEKLK